MTNAPTTVRTERPAEGVARIVLARPEKRNAQSRAMTYELNDAFDAAARDDAVRVIVLAGDGPDFSSGHDLRDSSNIEDPRILGTSGSFERAGAEGFMAYEEELYLEMCWRWRNIPKPTVAAVQGRAIAGALMLVWVCDLVIAADNAEFSDVTVAMGVNGVEYFAHPWELGHRKAKELLFTGQPIGAHDAMAWGMVNRVVPVDRLEVESIDMAAQIASRPSFALKLAKESVNATLDQQGYRSSLHAAFAVHQLAHSHNRERFGVPVDPSAFG